MESKASWRSGRQDQVGEWMVGVSGKSVKKGGVSSELVKEGGVSRQMVKKGGVSK